MKASKDEEDSLMASEGKSEDFSHAEHQYGKGNRDFSVCRYSYSEFCLFFAGLFLPIGIIMVIT